MLKKIATYHTGYRFLAMVLFVSSVLSFVGHACMVDDAHAGPMVKQCCCEESHGGHEGMKEMPGEPCEKEENSHNGDHHDKTNHRDCCSTEVQSLSVDATARIKAPPLEQPSASEIAYHEWIIKRLRFSEKHFCALDSLPLFSAPLRILYAQFLI